MQNVGNCTTGILLILHYLHEGFRNDTHFEFLMYNMVYGNNFFIMVQALNLMAQSCVPK